MATTKTPEEIAEAVQEWSALAIRADEDARKKLSEDALTGLALNSFNIKPALEAQAAALPWRKVARLINRGSTAWGALREVREDATETLLDGRESQSTCAITNDVERAEREALRNFLRQTSRLAG